MNPPFGSMLLCLGAVGLTSLALNAAAIRLQAAEPARTEVTALPRIPQNLHNLLQGREFERAIRAIDQLAGQTPQPESAEYLLYLKGLAFYHLDRQDEALKAYAEVIQKFPAGDWISRARFGQAQVYSRQRNYQAAAEIYKTETERLLSAGRRDELTGLYLEFADRYYTGEHVVGPVAEKKPDYAQALPFYQQALSMRPSLPNQQKIELRIARCQQETGQSAQAILNYQAFLASHAGARVAAANRAAAELEAEARYRLGLAQLAAGQSAEARKTWEDFLESDVGMAAGGDLAADAAYRLAQTFGAPQPATVGEMELAVARLERFLKAYPEHTLAPQAEFDIAQCYRAHGRFDRAVSRLKALIDNPGYGKSPQVASAWNQLGQAYAAQKKYEDAIAAWRQFLDRFPSDPGWSDVQRLIIDTEYAMAEEERRTEHFDVARTQWETFLNKYPLDPRAAQILLTFGHMNFAMAARLQNPPPPERADLPPLEADPARAAQLFEAAIVDWQKVVSKYPGTTQASEAALAIGRTVEERLNRLSDALEAFQKVEGQHQPEAQKRIAQLTAKRLEIVTERKFRSDEQPRIKLTTRNLESVTVKLYRVDLGDYFRKMHLATGVESLDIALIDPDETLERKIEGFEKYRRAEQYIELPVQGPGVTAVTVSSDSLEATTMVVVSDLDIIVKSSRNELFVFVENMLKGQPAAGVKLLVSDGSRLLTELETGELGVVQKSLDELKTIADLRVFAIQEGHTASSVLSLDGLSFAVGLAPKGYLSTDRPAYRAGQIVQLKGVIRWVDEDRFTYKVGEKYQLDIHDARGRTVHSQAIALGEFGSFAARFVLPATSPQGVYRVHVHQPGRVQSYETSFLVHDYQLEAVQFSVDVTDRVVYRGEKVKGKFTLKYQYGTPLADREIQYRLGDDRLYTARTDDKGEVSFELDTQRYSESRQLVLAGLFPERNLEAAAQVFVATRGFEIDVSLLRGVYLANEKFDVSLAVASPAGKAVAVPLTLQVYEQLPAARGLPAGERLVSTIETSSDEKEGKARQAVSIERAGRYLIRATGKDRFGNEISGQTPVLISGQDDQVRLRLLADSHHFRVGETGAVQVHWRDKPALALVTFEGASILGYRLVTLQTGANALEFPLEEKLAPNFELSVTVMEGGKFHEARSDFRVARDLRIRISPAATLLNPGDPLAVDLEVTDASGKPVSAELSLAIVQKSLLQMFGRQGLAIDSFFNSDRRQVSLRTTTSCVFRYQPPTRPINLFLLNEVERQRILAAEAAAHAVAEKVLAEQLAQSQGVDPLSVVEFAGDELASALNVDLNRNDAVTFSANTWETQNRPDLNVLSANDLASPNFGSLGAQASNFNFQGQSTWYDMNSNRLRMESRFSPFFRGGNDRSGLGNESSVGLQQLQQAGEGAGKPGATRLGKILNLTQGGNGVLPSVSQFDVYYGNNDLSRVNVAFFNTGIAHYKNSGDFKTAGSDRFLSELSKNSTQLFGISAAGEYQVLNHLSVATLAKLAAEGMEVVPAAPSAETAYWNPTVITDEQGKAKLTLRLPDQSTAWTLVAEGITRDSQAGQAQVEVVTRKDLFAEVRLPLGFTVGDKAEIPVEVHHPVAITEPIEVKFQAVFGERTVELKRTLVVDKPGITELSFPLEVAPADSAEIAIVLSAGNRKDRVERSVPVLDYGLPVFAAASGSSAQSTSFQIQFPAGMAPQRSQLELVIGPSIHRGLLDTVLGSTVSLYERRLAQPATDLERAVSDCVGGVAVLKLIGASRTTDSPEAQTLSGKIQMAIARLISAQRDDGGWSWSGRPTTDNSDRYLSSRAVWALAAARKAGFAVPAATFDKGVQQLQSAFAAADDGDLEGKAIVLHGLAEAGSADFAHANRLHRSRQTLTASGLVHLALTFQRLDKPEFAQEILTLAKARIPSRPVPARGETDAAMRGCIPWMQSGVELRALYLLALVSSEPAAAQNAELAEWLMSVRVGSRWTPEKANAPAIAALAEWFGRGKLLNEKYTLSIYANDRLVEKIAIDPAIEPSRVVAVPAKLLVADKPQRINFDMDGRGTFSYSAVLTGFVPADKVRGTTQEFAFTRNYSPAPRLLDGQEIPRGFSNLTGQVKTFQNPLTQLPLGERGEVSISIWRREIRGTANEQFDYLVYTEPIPAGAVVVPETIQGTFDRYEIVSGAITFYLGDRAHIGSIRFSIAGVLPGSYRCAPSVLRSFYQPEQFAVAKDLPLDVLPRGVASKDDYNLTPMELFEFGKRLVAKGDYAKAAGFLQPLFRDYRMTDQFQTELVKMLFQVALEQTDHQSIVQFFEIIKERFPDYEVPFESILKVAQSYIQLGEYERGYLVYRATAEASFLRENQIAGFLDGRGEFLRSVQVVERLLREYPAESYVATATYALAQELQGKAPEAASDARLKAANVTRIDLFASSIRMLDHFLSNWPTDPAADQVAFTMANGYLELERYKQAIERCTRFADLYPESKFLDSFWYVIGFSQFAEGRHEEALATCRKVADFKRIDPVTGVAMAAANKDPAIYIMGQVYHSLGKPAQAIAEYEKVRDQFPDARESIDFFLHKQITLPEVTTVKPGTAATATLKFRNVKGAAIKAYRIDLLKFGLLQRNLSRITAINLAGIRPYHEQQIELGDGLDYRDRERELEMPLVDEGAYLVVAQGENLYTSGLVLVSPLLLEIQEDAAAGRVRVTVRDTIADRYAHKIHVKVIGSRNEQFISGDTDLRGLFVADGILGTSTVIAKTESNRYAFYRGKLPLGAPEQPVEAKPATVQPQPADGNNSLLLKNLNDFNRGIQQEQRMNYRNMLDNKDHGVKAKKAY